MLAYQTRPLSTPAQSGAHRLAVKAAALLATPVLLCAPAAQAASLLIDDFSAPSPAFTATVTGNNTLLQRDFTATVPGGVREVIYNLYTNPQGSSVAVSVGDGSVSVSAGEGALGESVFYYGGFTRPTGDINVGGPNLGLDLTGYNAIELDFASVAQALNINYTLYTANAGGGLPYNGAGINVAPATAGGPVTVIIPFASTAFNFSQVDGVAFLIDRSGSATGNKYVLSSAHFVTTTVPEASSVLMMLAGVGVLGAALRRRSARAEG
jgi:hypothetical protein